MLFLNRIEEMDVIIPTKLKASKMCCVHKQLLEKHINCHAYIALWVLNRYIFLAPNYIDVREPTLFLGQNE